MDYLIQSFNVFAALHAEMPCGHCHQPGHNRRTCERYQARKVATMIAENYGKELCFGAMDMVCPGAGVSASLLDKAWGYFGAAGQLSSKTKNERFRGALAILFDGDT